MLDNIFVGRKKEIEQLNLLLNKKSASLVVVRGRRRIGKSRLIEKFAMGKLFCPFAGIPPTLDTDDQTQRNVFAKQLGQQFRLPGLQADDWMDLFTLLANQTKNGRVIILFDEISWMADKDSTFLGKLKNAWDMELKKNPKLILILCGSVSTWIEENIISSTGFFGRISLTLNLQELPLNDCNKMLISQGIKAPAHEIFKLLSITGGIPWYLEHIQSKLTADENVKNLCFKKNSILLNEFELIFHDLFAKRSDIYRRIIILLAHGAAEFSQISEETNYPNSGMLSNYLDDLIMAGFISRDFTWSLKTGKSARLSHYRLSDNYLRFYLRYVEPNMEKILNDRYDEFAMSSLSNWHSIMGLQFENLVLKNRHVIYESLHIRPEDIVADNPFFQRKTQRQAGCQIDYLIQTRTNTLYVCEIKFSAKELPTEIIDTVKQKIERLQLPRNYSTCAVLIHVNGVQDAVFDSGYFFEIIDFCKFLNQGSGNS